MYDTDQISGFVLPFHCYSEPNGDVVFTKNKRTRDDYDARGNSIVTESVVESRIKDQSIDSKKTPPNSGCLSLFILLLVIAILSSYIQNM